MAENGTEKHFGPIDRIKEITGIYSLGFERESVAGFLLPWIIFIVLCAVLGAVIAYYL
ncbi:MAG: hypothetical protein ACJ789_05985 [Thermomicrobiales bacterium]